MLRLVGLDLDGTLIDSAPDLSDALGRALESLDLPPAAEADTRRWIGDGIELLIERGIAHASGGRATPNLVQAALTAFDAHYRKHFFSRSHLYPGVLDTLKHLRRQGLVCVCITNKRIAFAQPLLVEAGLAPWIDHVVGGDSCARRKPFPDPLLAAARLTGIDADDAVMIGDSPNDMDAAYRAGWRFVFARYGYTAAMRARGLKPLPAIDSFAELTALLPALDADGGP